MDKNVSNFKGKIKPKSMAKKSVVLPNTQADPPKQVTLNVKTLMGDRVFNVTMPVHLPVMSLKVAIQRKYHVSMSNQTIVYNNLVLLDEKALATYNLPNDATLYILPSMKSGPIDYKINTEALAKFMNQVKSDVSEMKKQFEEIKVEVEKGSKSAHGPLRKKDVVMLTFNKTDGTYKVTLLPNNTLAPSSSSSAADVKLNNPENLKNSKESQNVDEQANEKTRRKMAELRQKMEQSKEKRTRHRLAKVAALKKSDHVTPIEFVDAEAVIDEADWNKLIKRVAEKREKPTIIGLSNELMDAVEPDTDIDFGNLPNLSKRSSDMLTLPPVKQLSTMERKVVTSREFAERQKRAVVKIAGHEIYDDDDTSDSGSDDESSEVEAFFDCQEVEDQKSLWQIFVDWLYLVVFHFKLKIFGGSATDQEGIVSNENEDSSSEDSSDSEEE